MQKLTVRGVTLALALGLWAGSAAACILIGSVPVNCSYNLLTSPGGTAFIAGQTTGIQTLANQLGLGSLISPIFNSPYNNPFSQSMQMFVSSGALDQTLNTTLNNLTPLFGAINGTGPGGAAFTNAAALNVFNGTSSLLGLSTSLAQTSPVASQFGGLLCGIAIAC
jgi:hypothetical protein